MLMRMEDPICMSVTVHKLRFHFIKDFWVFVAHLAYGRVASYSMLGRHINTCSEATE